MTYADGPYYDDLSPGHAFPVPPAVTVTSGLAATYLALSGDAPALTIDGDLCRAVTGSDRPLANPALVLHLANGASTVASRKVLGNLFYRNVVLRRPVFEGETLRTRTVVTAMADGRARPDRAPRGKVLLSITTTIGDEVVLDYQRCPLLPCRGDELPGHADQVGGAEADDGLGPFVEAAPISWDLNPLGPPDRWSVGEERLDPMRDVVDGATALVRLSHNLAAVHRDPGPSLHGQRLVYGGHTVSLAQASLVRVLDGLVTVVGWRSCDHTGPVFEGDMIECTHRLEAAVPLATGQLRLFRSQAIAHRPDREPATVLDWWPVVHTT